MQCGALHVHVYDAYLGKCCVDQGSRVRHEFYVNEGVWACRNAPSRFKIKYLYGLNVEGNDYK